MTKNVKVRFMFGGGHEKEVVGLSKAEGSKTV